MPALHLDELLSALASQAIQPDSALSIAPSNATNATRLATSPLQVVCAWPVSGQYGPGSRVLYYFLVAACILARKAEWLRNACLAAALLLPAVAALHGVALAALHDNGAVDMDIYGAFQLCSIAVLTAPVVVRLSRTYFYDPGRNIIFLWTTFLLAGLLSLTVEFYRTNPVECRVDANGNPLTPQDEFPWGVNGTCNITCDTNNGPFSYMRGGAQNNLYVVPVPNVLTFGTATLLCAACCIPSILSFIFMWDKIREINCKRHFAREQDSDDKPIEGTNGATPATMNSINRVIKGFIGAVEAPVFGVAVFAILISGEINFFTVQVNYETEPMASVGQWAPIVGTGLAAIGSLYIWLAAQVDGQGTEEKKLPAHHCNCSHHQDDEVRLSRLERHLGLKDPAETMPRSPEADEEPSDVQHAEIHQIVSTTTARDSNTLAPMMSQATQPQLADGGRRRVARWLTSFANYVGTAAQDRFNNGEFQHGKATNFPEIPGEALRNHRLVQIRTQYNAHPDDDDSMPGLYRSRSRAHSFVSNASGLDDDAARTPRRTSPMRSSPPDPPSPTSLRIRTRIAHRRSTDPVSPSVDTVPALARRRDTLEVPPTVHHRDSHLSPHQ